MKINTSDEKRRTIRLSRVDQKTAESIRLWIEELNIALSHGMSASVSTALWLESIGAAVPQPAGQLPDRPSRRFPADVICR